MTFRERMFAALRGQPADAIPVMFYHSVTPRSHVELGLRRRGAGFCLRRAVVWQEQPTVNSDVQAAGDITTTQFHTAEGTLTTRVRTHMGRLADHISCEIEPLIKRVGEIPAATALADDAVYHVDPSGFTDFEFEIGDDGFVRCEGPMAPYDASAALCGYHWGALNKQQALLNWLYLQSDTEAFADLMAVLQARQQRFLQAACESPVEVISLGCLDGAYGPARWREQTLPWYREAAMRLRKADKISVLHAHAPNLRAFLPLVAETGVDLVEGVTLGPFSDLTLSEVRVVLGPDVTILVNIPETLFWGAAQRVRAYVADLIAEDAGSNRLILGCTELGVTGVIDDETAAVHAAGYAAIMDAVAG